jgi:hypothetical protein
MKENLEIDVQIPNAAQALCGRGAAIVAVLFIGGCAGGPKYEMVEQADSANIERAVMPVQGSEFGTCSVTLMKIDNAVVNVTISHVGMNFMIYNAKKPIPLSPGSHTLSLYLSDIEESIGNVGHGDVGVVGRFTAASHPVIVANLLPRHEYRIGANMTKKNDGLEIDLWDVSKESTGRTKIFTWTVDSNGMFADSATSGGGHH